MALGIAPGARLDERLKDIATNTVTGCAATRLTAKRQWSYYPPLSHGAMLALRDLESKMRFKGA